MTSAYTVPLLNIFIHCVRYSVRHPEEIWIEQSKGASWTQRESKKGGDDHGKIFRHVYVTVLKKTAVIVIETVNKAMMWKEIDWKRIQRRWSRRGRIRRRLR